MNERLDLHVIWPNGDHRARNRAKISHSLRAIVRLTKKRRRRFRACSAVLPWLLLAVAYSGRPSLAGGVGWRELAPLPKPRFFHSAVFAEGRVFVLGGRVLVGPESYNTEYGIGKWGLRWYEPDRDRWVHGPSLEVGVVVNRTTRVSYLSGERRETPDEFTSGGVVDYEYPLVGVVPAGPIVWLGEPTPAVFHPSRGVWDAPPTLWDAKTWNWISSVPEMIRTRATAAVGSDGRIYAIGGIGHPLVQRDRPVPPKPLYSLFDSMDAYDPATHTWEKRAPMRRARQLFGATFARDGKLYVFGGYGHVGAVRQAEGESDEAFQARVEEMRRFGREALRDVEVYDPATDTWEERTPMPLPRHAMDAVLGADGRIYVVGGAVSYSHPVATASVQVYDPETDRWERGPSMRHSRFQHAVAADPDGRIYAIGGFEHKFLDERPTASVEMLDTASRP